MNNQDLGWQAMATAPRTGAAVRVAIRASEQGPAQTDVVRWGKPPRDDEACWIAMDSDPDCLVCYSDAELSGWEEA